MIEPVLIISFMVFAIWYTMQPGEIFGKLGDWLERNLPEVLHSPVFDCAICMTPWYGSAIYWLIWGQSWLHWLSCVIGAMGLNVILSKLFPDKDERDTD
jgi:hypothetical protein